MNLYLFNQKRDRDLDEYLTKLQISKEEFESINDMKRRLLMIGGGNSLIQNEFQTNTLMHIINIDLNPPSDNFDSRIQNIKGDFLTFEPTLNYFDEIWALYSLPLYASNPSAIELFFLKSFLTLKSKGVLRFFPLEYDENPKLHTKDADYDMTTMECTKTVLRILEKMNCYGIKCVNKEWNGANIDRKENSVKIELSFKNSQKNQINTIISGKIKKIKNYQNVHCFTNPEEEQIYSNEEKKDTFDD